MQLERDGPAPKLEAAIHSMEVTFRMQSEVMDTFNVRQESEKTRECYGDGDFARGCLIARRLIESGVRVVQIYYGNMQPWDTHEDVQRMPDPSSEFRRRHRGVDRGPASKRAA